MLDARDWDEPWWKLTETQEIYRRRPTVLNMGRDLLRRSFPFRTDKNCTKKSSSQLKNNKKGEGVNTRKVKKCKCICECNDQ